MTLNELYRLTIWIESEISEKQILQLYQGLHAILNQNAQPNRPKQPFEQEKNNLIDVLGHVPINQLSHEQLAMLERFGIAQYIGQEGITYIEDVLFKHAIDIATAATKVGQAVQSISEGINKANQIRAGLEGCVEDEEPESGQIIMRVHFSGRASMENIKSFKEWGNVWFDIGRGIAMATGSAPEEIKIISAGKGSIIVDLAVVYGVAEVASKVVTKGLEIAERVLKLRAEVENIRHLKLKNKQIVKELEQEVEQEKEAGVQQAIEAMVKELQLNKDNQGDKKEALSKAITKLIDFIDKGGDVDFVLPDEADVESEGGKDKSNKKLPALRKNVEQIRKLEHSIKALEHDENG
ncbi:MAG: hypothetical protein D6698_05635 [Gammaproteobacteria bacterium]|nr:MAG: hypothetical protein D6698_05635 [Gammaproteobacteria bacterium]